MRSVMRCFCGNRRAYSLLAATAGQLAGCMGVLGGVDVLDTDPALYVGLWA